jgi:hypothetical protein
VHTIKPQTVELSAEGALKITGIGGPTSHILMLPASTLWLDTGIDIGINRGAHVVCAGQISLSIVRLVEAPTGRDWPTRNLWNGPSGIDPADSEDPLDFARRKLWLAPEAPLGSVVAYVSDKNPRLLAHPSGIKPINKGDRVVPGPGRLWLSVNDWVFEPSEESREAYVSDKKILTDSKYRQEDGKPYTTEYFAARWERFKTAGRREAWYDDNVGEFLVQITIVDCKGGSETESGC